ncbi:MAG: tetratricopeptide repeat protein, partial [Pseudomonadota bacterium]
LSLTSLIYRPNQTALEKAADILKRSREKNDIVTEAFVTSILAEAKMTLGRADELGDYARALRELNETLNYPRFDRDILRLESDMLRMQGDTIGALEKRRELIDFYEAAGRPRLAAMTLNGVANTLYDLGDYEAALEHYVFAIEQLGEKPRRPTANEAVLLKNAGSALTDLDRHDEALAYYEKALEIDAQLGSERGLAYTKFWMAKSLHALGRRERAVALAQEAAALSEQYSSAMQTANIFVWLADRALENGSADVAEDALQRSATILGLAAGDDLDARLGRADQYWAVSYARGMAAALADMGNDTEALRYAQYALDRHEAWLAAEKVQAAVDTKTLFEIRTKDQEIRLLESESRLQQAELALRDSALDRQQMRTVMSYSGVIGFALIASLAAFGWRNAQRLASVRETLVSEEHHRTKNALQIASSLVRAGDSENVGERLFTMGLVYDQLYTVENQSVTDAAPFLGELLDKLMTALAPPGVSAALSCRAGALSANLATPIGLMVCEMAINALKYAFPEKRGVINVDLVEVTDGLLLSVKDNGVGEKASGGAPGAGHQLIRDLASQLNANAVFEQSSEGSVWTVGPIARGAGLARG